MSMDTASLLDRLYQLRTRARTPEEQEALDVAADGLSFILSLGKLHAFEDYRERLGSNAAPVPLCSFDTREAAEAWLTAHPEPPHGAAVAVGGTLYTVAYVRQSGHRALLRLPMHGELDGDGSPES
ncbi:hypothetical protein [Corallococcus llansteffanensis]|uniref:Uncharacterized protein n=1 Tax=Corallococcus llansteffanensis TaxID=2316731 RepID=A0A3A8NKS7_9BACT|nr:hypothetical protein [Corallococcus llansteffanensis]RKH45006.1 hypothetical protein D7V93_35780 [Corallococcus llansteffanensis]